MVTLLYPPFAQVLAEMGAVAKDASGGNRGFYDELNAELAGIISGAEGGGGGGGGEPENNLAPGKALKMRGARPASRGAAAADGGEGTKQLLDGVATELDHGHEELARRRALQVPYRVPVLLARYPGCL